MILTALDYQLYLENSSGIKLHNIGYIVLIKFILYSFQPSVYGKIPKHQSPLRIVIQLI